MEPKTNNHHIDDRSSSSDELEIESRDDKMQQESSQLKEPQLDIRNFIELGELLDMQVGHKWVTAIVHGVTQKSILISPSSKPQDQQWVDFDFLIFRKQWIPGVQLHETFRVEVKNKIEGWLEATIIEIQATYIKVHYNGYKQIYDEVITIPTDLVAPLGMYTKTMGIGSLLRQDPQCYNKFTNRFHTYLQEWSQFAVKKLFNKLESNFPQLLSESGFMIKEIGGDGNCMFRAVSDQLYGTEIYHRELRMFAIQYIILERKFYQDFVVGGDIEKYVAYKSQDGVWGDNIELQAFRELYDIPIEVYVYSTIPLKTGLEVNPKNQEPIRISYHGKSHYNSIKPTNQSSKALLSQHQCGDLEQSMLNKLKKKNEESQNQEDELLSSSRSTTQSLLGKPNMMEDVFNESRLMFEQELKKKETQQFIQNDADDQLLDMAIKQSTQDTQVFNQQANQDDAIESQILQGIMEESKKNQQLEQDIQLQKMIEESAIEKAIKDSAQTHEKTMYEDPLNNPIIAQVMSMGHFQLDMVLEAYTVVGDDPDMIINYIYENFM